MPTHTIGSNSRQYSSIQLWEDDIPATITEDYVGELYNDSDSFVTSGTILDISGHTGSFWIRLRPASGQGFKDNGSIRSTALNYNRSNGVGLRCTGEFIVFIEVNQPRFEISGIQIKMDANNSPCIDAGNSGITTPSLFKDLLIIERNRRGIYAYGSAAVVANVVVYCDAATNNDAFRCGAGSVHIGCSAILDAGATPGATGFGAEDGNNILRSCCSFGWTTAASATQWDTTNSQRNATNLSSGLPGSNNVHSVSYNDTSPFTNVDSASVDLRAISGTDLINAGYQDTTNAANDISNTVRDATPTIGHWEVVVAATGIFPTRILLLGVGQ